MLVHVDKYPHATKPTDHDCAVIRTYLQEPDLLYDVDATNLSDALSEGRSVSPGVIKGEHKNDFWVSQQVFMVDIDNKPDEPTPPSPDDALAHIESLGVTPMLWYETFSSTPEKPRYREVFALDEPVTTEDDRVLVTNALYSVCTFENGAHPDRECLDAARIFHGTDKGVHMVDPDARMTLEQMRKLLPEPGPDEKMPSPVGTFKSHTCSGDSELRDIVEHFDLLGLMRMRNGETACESKDYVKFKNCEICGHHEDLVYYYKTNTFSCFGGGSTKGGSIIDYLMLADKLSLPDAITDIKKMSGIDDGRTLPPPRHPHVIDDEPDEELPDGDEKRGKLVIRDAGNHIGDKLSKRRPTIIDGLLRAGGKMSIIGAPKSQKSCEAIHLGVELAIGGEWLGHRCSKRKVLYLSTEGDENDLEHTLDCVCNTCGVGRDEISGSFKYVTTTGKSFDGTNPITISTLYAWMMDNLHKGEFDVVIVDCIYKLEEGEEDAEHIGSLLLFFDMLVHNLGLTIVYVHHTSKGGDWGKSVFEMGRGSGSFGMDAEATVSFSELRLDERTNPEIWDAIEGMGISDPGSAAYRVRQGARTFDKPADFNAIKTYPLYTPDTDGLLEPLSMRGAANVSGGESTSKRCAAVRSSKDKAVGNAIEVCRSMGKPATRENVFGYLADECSKVGVDSCTYDTFRGWTSRPKGATHYRSDPSHENVLRPCETDKHDRVLYEDGKPTFLPSEEEVLGHVNG